MGPATMQSDTSAGVWRLKMTKAPGGEGAADTPGNWEGGGGKQFQVVGDTPCPGICSDVHPGAIGIPQNKNEQQVLWRQSTTFSNFLKSNQREAGRRVWSIGVQHTNGNRYRTSLGPTSGVHPLWTALK
jgi:hypothetical protein